jgi:glycosyltransferase involved in cell wall biosynthesis
VALAQVLKRAGHGVTLAVPNDPCEAGTVGNGVELVEIVLDSLGAQADGHDVVLIHGHLGNHYLSQRDDLPVVVDLYDPFLIENLHYHRELGFEPYRTDHATWKLQLGRGDFFLCSSLEQRFFYLGWLGALGRVNPLALDDDPGLDRLIAELPFGTPAEDPPPRPPRSSLFPGVDESAPVLYFGGIYDWYDPAVVLDALPEILKIDDRAVVIFVEHPHPEGTPLSSAASARRVAESRGWLGRSVRFEAWRPYDRRFELASASDLAVVTHRPGLETELSLRTRMVDLLWLGLPVISTTGGAMARVIDSIGAGRTVAPKDPLSVSNAVRWFLENPQAREDASAAGQRWARARGWESVARPLLEFVSRPRRDRNRDRFVELAPCSGRAAEPLFSRLGRRLKVLGKPT